MPVRGMFPAKLFKEGLVTRNGTVIEVRAKGTIVKSKSVEANVLYEILLELQKQNKGGYNG